jgi:hypothetical protein
MAKATVLKKLAAAALTPTRGGHSPLYLAMWRDYADVAPLFNRSRPNWEQIAKVYAEAGALDGTGQVATAVTARQTWRKVCRDKKREAYSPPQPPQTTAQPAPMPLAAAEAPSGGDDSKPPRPRFGLARARGLAPRPQ